VQTNSSKKTASNILNAHMKRTPNNNSTYIFKDDVVVMIASTAQDDRLIKAFNSDRARVNLDVMKNEASERRKRNYEEGKFFQILFLTGKYYQGTNIRGVRRFHMFDYLPGYTLQKQLNGRATRAGSHSSLDPDKRNIKIFKYKTQPYDGQDIMQFIEYSLRKPLREDLYKKKVIQLHTFADNIDKIQMWYNSGRDILNHNNNTALGVVPNTIIRRKAKPSEIDLRMENVMGKYNIGEITKLLRNRSNRSKVMQLYENHIKKRSSNNTGNRVTTGNQKRPRVDNALTTGIRNLKATQNHVAAGLKAKELLNKIKASQLNKAIRAEYVQAITSIVRNKTRN
ncbi:MAG: hypothetical protein ACO35F_11760, partial [Ilumatobacteraceae bacterium]